MKAAPTCEPTEVSNLSTAMAGSLDLAHLCALLLNHILPCSHALPNSPAVRWLASLPEAGAMCTCSVFSWISKSLPSTGHRRQAQLMRGTRNEGAPKLQTGLHSSTCTMQHCSLL